MILAIDTGNTHTVIGCMEIDGEIEHIMRIESNPYKTEYEYAANMKLILELNGVNLQKIEGAVISSVVPPLTVILKKAVKLITGVDALVVGAGVKTGLPIMIDDPGTIASDLVATAVAAKEYYPLPCIIIDMGTATTVTVVDQKGRYIGGAILPGVDLSMDALTRGTSLLPKIEIVPPNKVIATNTVECMKAGIIFGSAGAIDGVLDRFTEIQKIPIQLFTQDDLFFGRFKVGRVGSIGPNTLSSDKQFFTAKLLQRFPDHNTADRKLFA